ncbi:MAG: glycosyltransferase family A protein [Elusimicrobiales bacterium]|jgi:glycosyltransferase involved in cell wall biosynthesis
MPKISVVIPLYNKAAHIIRALDSVTAQTERDFEIVVVDDGSTDGGGMIVRTYPDPRVKYLHQENSGVSSARNNGVAHAQSDFISFLDADDEYAPKFIATLLALRQKYPQAGIYSTAYYFVGVNGRKIKPKYRAIPQFPWEGILPNYFESALGEPPVCASASAVAKAVLSCVGNFPLGEAFGEDLDMWFRIAMKYPVAFSSYEGAVYHCEAQNRISSRYLAIKGFKLVETAKNALNSGSVARESVSFVKGIIDKHLLISATHCIYDGDNLLAKKYLAQMQTNFFLNKKRFREVCLHIPYPILKLIIFVRNKFREM